VTILKEALEANHMAMRDSLVDFDLGRKLDRE
jgi:hypothetical protein